MYALVCVCVCFHAYVCTLAHTSEEHVKASEETACVCVCVLINESEIFPSVNSLRTHSGGSKGRSNHCSINPSINYKHWETLIKPGPQTIN